MKKILFIYLFIPFLTFSQIKNAVTYNGKILTYADKVLFADIGNPYQYLFSDGYTKTGDYWYVVDKMDNENVKLVESNAFWGGGGGAYFKSGIIPDTLGGQIEVDIIYYTILSHHRQIFACTDAVGTFKCGFDNSVSKMEFIIDTDTILGTTELQDEIHYKLTYKWTDTDFYIYVNDVLEATNTWTGNFPEIEGYMFILNDNGIRDANTYHVGYCWDFKFYDKNFNIIRYYPLQEGDGRYIYDVINEVRLRYSGNGGKRFSLHTGGYHYLGGFQNYSHYNLFNGFCEYTDAGMRMRIPAKLDGSSAADGNAITNPAGTFHNDAETKIEWKNRNNTVLFNNSATLSSYRSLSNLFSNDSAWHPKEFEVNIMNNVNKIDNLTYVKETDTTLSSLLIYNSISENEKIKAQKIASNDINNFDCYIKSYSQGVVCANDEAFYGSEKYQYIDEIEGQAVIQYDLITNDAIRTYSLNIYDSSPILLTDTNNNDLFIVSDIKYIDIRAYDISDGSLCWDSENVGTNNLFLGFSYYQKNDSVKIILYPSATNGKLYAINIENGNTEWTVTGSINTAITPAVAQDSSWIFFQCDGWLKKINAENGTVIDSVSIPLPVLSSCTYNTVFANDTVITFWYKNSCANEDRIRVYDKDLNFVWENDTLFLGKKTPLTYHDGYIFVGGGDVFLSCVGNYQKYVVCFKVSDGSQRWVCDLTAYDFHSIMNTIYADGFVYAEANSQDVNKKSYLFKINATTGILAKTIQMDYPMSNCATPCIYDGKWYSGTLFRYNRMTITPIDATTKKNWISAFGDGQGNWININY